MWTECSITSAASHVAQCISESQLTLLPQGPGRTKAKKSPRLPHKKLVSSGRILDNCQPAAGYVTERSNSQFQSSLRNAVIRKIFQACGMPRHFHLHRSPHWDIFFFVKYDIIQRCGNGSKVDLKFLLSESDPKRNFRKIDCRDKHKCIIPNHKQTRRAGRLPQGHHRSL